MPLNGGIAKGGGIGIEPGGGSGGWPDRPSLRPKKSGGWGSAARTKMTRVTQFLSRYLTNYDQELFSHQYKE